MTTGDAACLIEELARLTDAVKRLGALAQQSAEPQSSVELSRNAKGAAQWTAKVYAQDPTAAAYVAQELYDDLAVEYGQPEASAA